MLQFQAPTLEPWHFVSHAAGDRQALVCRARADGRDAVVPRQGKLRQPLHLVWQLLRQVLRVGGRGWLSVVCWLAARG